MNAASLLKLRPGERVVHLASGEPGVVTAAAAPTRAQGWRVPVRTANGTSWLTPANIQNWGLGG